MFQLLQPLWLYAIAAIAIPLLIHLWDVRGGKKLLVGSVSLIEESARQQGRSLRLTDILLLIIRCLLIILLAFLLARPTWKKQLSSSTEKGWVLIEKGSIQEAYNNFKPSIDSLLKAGHTFHYFSKGFPAYKFEEALSDTDEVLRNQTSYWTLLKQLNEQVPVELPVHLYTDNKLKRFQGKRPEVSMALTWHTFTSADSLRKAGAIAYQTPGDSIRFLSANSNSSATFYTSETISNSGNSQYSVVDNKIHFSGANQTREEIALDTTDLHIAVYTDLFHLDAAYLKAALEAIQQFTQRIIQVHPVSKVADIKSGMDWIFWLSEKPVSVQQPKANFVIYEKGKEQSIHSWIRILGDAEINQEPVKLTRRIQFKDVDKAHVSAVWQDGYGAPLLSLSEGTPNVYHYYSRFSPDWNELAWSPQFAEMLCNLIIDKPEIPFNQFDKRVIDDAQLQPQFAKEKKAFDKEKFVNTTDLTKIFWLAAFVVFCIERYLSLKQTKRRVYA